VSVPSGHQYVSVVPVRMQEAWLLHDVAAIRKAAGRPSGTEALNLPVLSRLESVADAKVLLHNAIRLGSGLSGRRAQRFDPARRAFRVADLIADWRPLRTLSAFQRLEQDTRAALRAIKARLRQC
jgi:hypothetical protein